MRLIAIKLTRKEEQKQNKALLLIWLFFLMCMGVLCTMSVHQSCAWSLWGSEEGVISLRTGVTGDCEPLLVLRMKTGSSGKAASVLNS